jgi:hypothetical protein
VGNRFHSLDSRHEVPQLIACGPFRRSLRSFCGPACREQSGTDEKSRPKTPVFSRLSPAIAARCKDLILRLFIGETSSKTPERPTTAGRDGAPATRMLPSQGEAPASVASSDKRYLRVCRSLASSENGPRGCARLKAIA